jgi:hypothetical protein
MGNELYKLVFAGIAVDRDVEHVKQNLAGIFKVDPVKIDSLIKKKSVVIKKGLKGGALKIFNFIVFLRSERRYYIYYCN